MQPGVSESNQDNLSANLHELAEIIRRDERVDELTQRLKGYTEYGLDAKWNHLPYVNPTIIHRQAKDEIPPQRYYYAVIVTSSIISIPRRTAARPRPGEIGCLPISLGRCA
jgi:hypothetical protein